MLRINNFLSLTICKCKCELITKICFKTLKYKKKKMCKCKNLRGPFKYKNINKLKNSSETNKANALWALGDYKK